MINDLIIGGVVGFIAGSIISDIIWYSYVQYEFGPLWAYAKAAHSKQKLDEEIMSTLSNFDMNDIEIQKLIARVEDTDGKEQEVETK